MLVNCILVRAKTRNRTNKLNIEKNSDSEDSDQELDRKQVSFQ